jgi:hypothetical protein
MTAKVLEHVALDKVLGRQPSRLRSAIAAGAVGTVTASVLYKFLRRPPGEH